MKMQHNICILCLNVVKNEFREMDELMKQIFEVLLLKLDLKMNRDHIICQECIEIAKKCLKFKLIYLGTEQIVLSFFGGMENAKHSIKVIYRDRGDVKTVVDEDLDICRFCLTRLEKNDFVNFSPLMNDATSEILSEYMPEIDFNIIEDPIICTTCRENLVRYCKFVLNCLIMKDNIETSCREERTNDSSHVERLHKSADQFAYKEHDKETKSGLSVLETKEQYTESKEIDNVNRDMLIENQQETMFHKDISKIKMYNCTLCSYKGRFKSYMERHMLTHKDPSQLQLHMCSLCTYGSKRKSDLKQHMLIHKDISEIKWYRCSVCAYEAKYKNNLVRHMLVHDDVSEIKMYKCSSCAYEAKQKSSLTKHLLLHKDVSEIKMHNCPLCTYRAKRKNYLTKHMLVHQDFSKAKVCTV